ncbi:PREDICTED: calcitonin receptor isoform X1 [Cercocebus atys]|uniref:calcitonin receptor isoform X1 n=1 Tax=Cercocebus atys TaxID=9531 RepID=UPI0005F3E2A8|nr:PREDICTED: calcitonin receptor isoform X1 [Cercocebus atys]
MRRALKLGLLNPWSHTCERPSLLLSCARPPSDRIPGQRDLQKPKMRFAFTCRCFALFLLLNHPIPILPAFSNQTYPTIEPEPFLYIVGRKKMMDAQYKCYDRMQQLPPYQGEGPYCNRTWDGWLCWDDTPAGVLSYQFCPDYFPDFDPSEKVTKYCDENGVWFKHPENNRTWSNYTMCNAFTPEKLKNAYVLYYLAIVGHSLSIFTLVISLGIFVFFKSLGCQRVTLHKNMFLTYILNSMIIIIHLVEVVPNGELVRRDPVSCKILHFFHQYMMACNYFWMLCEGIYLHTLIVMAVFTEKQRLRWYYLLGWGFPLVPTTIHAITRAVYFNDNCWLSVETHLLYIIHGPVMAALVVNFFFLLNIVRVLVTKMRETHEAESHMYLKAVKATMILVPLLGIQFVVFPWRPSNKILGKIYDYMMHSLIHFQGFFVATIYCFCNNEVQTTVKRQWVQFKIQWNQRWGRRPSNRSARAAAAAEAGDIRVYICHQEPRNEPANNQGEESVEIIPLNIIEQETSA